MAVRSAALVGAALAMAIGTTLAMAPAAAAASRPSAPRSVAAKPGDTTVRVAWVPPLSDGGASIDNYAVQRAASSSGPWSTVKKVAATTFAWKNLGLVNGTRYYYRVQAHNSAGWSAASTVVSAVPRTLPSAPQSVTAQSGDGSATVSWGAPASDGGAPINGYRLQLSTDGVTWSVLSAGTQTHLTPGGLTNGTEYRFRVRAHNAAGWGPVSTEVRTTPGLPLPPTNLVGASSADGLSFSWTPSATGSPAVIEQEGESYTGTDVPFGVDFTPDTTGYGLDPNNYGVIYYFRIRARNSVGASDWVTTSAVSGLVPCPVINMSVTYIGKPLNEAAVDWAPSTSKTSTCGTRATSYHVERRVNGGSYVDFGNTSQTGYGDQNVVHGNTYWYRITPLNELGFGASAEVQFVY